MTAEPPARRSRTPPAEIVRVDRVDREGFHSWVVTVWKNGEERQRRFAEEDHASPSAAFSAGVRFRNRIVSRTGAVTNPSKERTGIPGISIGRVRTTAGRYVKNYTVSLYGADGKRRALVFSWLKYGKKQALELAKEALRKGREKARRSRRMPKKKTPTRTDEKRRLKSALALSKPTEHKNVRRVDHHHLATSWRSVGRKHGTRSTSATEFVAVVVPLWRKLSSTATRSWPSFPLPSGSIGGRTTRPAFPASRSSTIARDPREVKARVVVVGASAMDSTRILLNSKSTRFPNGIGNGSDQLGRNFCEQIMVHVRGYLPPLYGRGYTNDDRADGGHIYMPRFNHLPGHTRDYLRGFGMQFWGSGSQTTTVEAAKHLPGFGASFKAEVKKRYPALLSLHPFGEVLPRPENRVTLDESRTDRYRVPLMKIDVTFGENERKMRKHMYDTCREPNSVCENLINSPLLRGCFSGGLPILGMT
jgi:hypothetical protein